MTTEFLKDLKLSDLSFDHGEKDNTDTEELIRRLLRVIAIDVPSEVFDTFLEIAQAWDKQMDIFSVDEFVRRYFHRCSECGALSE